MMTKANKVEEEEEEEEEEKEGGHELRRSHLCACDGCKCTFYLSERTLEECGSDLAKRRMQKH
jgi:hypothetical protein